MIETQSKIVKTLIDFIRYWIWGIIIAIVGYFLNNLTGWTKSGPIESKSFTEIIDEFIQQPFLNIITFLSASIFIGVLLWLAFRKNMK